ncbi:hypothetical protein [Parasporobacterium paucivorans]|uniref:Uncharacterized protein n=1 Tax=Parasporobacterium paucivorans DSM 15970 TaxID=1122934 RepID=A0A1M6IUR8_9FIRM|nr:hypothetical protein [Parasporobacterium paucivorans]SHJ38191.1 hypothetical protein SAMN02745691_01860 [Parasporobacterium paucivorans DSM 15970]
MTTERLKIYSIRYLVDFIQKANLQNRRINILTAAGLIEGKVIIVNEYSEGDFPDFINGMLGVYEKDYDIDDPFMDDQRNAFITMENATLIQGPTKTRLKFMIIYLDEIIGVSLSEKE